MGRLRVVFVYSIFALQSFAGVFQNLPELPRTLIPQEQPSHSATLVIKEKVGVPEPTIVPMPGGQIRLQAPEMKTLGIETLPELPYLEKSYLLPSGARAEVVLQADAFEKSRGPLPLKTIPETHFWTNDPSFVLAPPGEGRYFPGHLFQPVQNGSKLTVRIFPYQWDRDTGELIWVSQLSVSVFETGKANRTPPERLVPTPKIESVIIAPDGLKGAATRLQNFHLKKHGISSEIISLEMIDRTQNEIAESELPDGYKDRKLADDAVIPFDPATGKGYRYSLARKLAGYLQSEISKNSTLKYVTLLGGVNHIPPSYYFSVRLGLGARFGFTDQCYGAIKQCMEPKVAVGRLPFSSETELTTYLEKVEQWLKDAPETKTELSLFGGKGFGGPFYVGELGLLRTLSATADWRGVKKHFRTKQNYSTFEVERTLRGETGTSFVYSLDHGGGNIWYVEDSGISSKAIDSWTSKGSTISPVIFSVACSNAAIDSLLSKEDLFTDSRFGSRSVGESLLRSPAGAVAYFGSSRPSAGAPVFDIDPAGNLEIKDSNHGLKILDTTLEYYRVKRGGRLGDAVLASFSEYAGSPAALVAKDRVRWSYFNAILLADPTLPLPARTKRETAYAVGHAVDEIEPGFTGYFPRLVLPSSGDVQIRFETPEEVTASLLRQRTSSGVVSESLMEEGVLAPGLSEVAFTDTTGRQTYFLRLENTKGVPVERQIWFRTQ